MSNIKNVSSATTRDLMFALFYQMQQEGRYCDVEIIAVTGERFVAHACILAAASTKFQSMFDTTTTDGVNKMKKVMLPEGIRGSTFNILLQLIYTCKFTLDINTRPTAVTAEENLSSSLENVDEEIGTAASLLGIKVMHSKVLSPHCMQKRIEKQNDTLKKGISGTTHINRAEAFTEMRLEEFTNSAGLGLEEEDKNDTENESISDMTPCDINIENECDVCKRSFRNKRTLELHLRNHAKLPDKKFHCTACEKIFKHRSTWQRHVGRCHINKTSKQKYRKKSQKQNIHTQVVRNCRTNTRSACTLCNKTFTSNYVMQLHLRTHTGEELFGCNVCGKRFPYKSSLTTHKVIHTGVKPYICSICGKTFTQKIHAKEHESQHSGYKRFKCTECNKEFSHKSGLTRHVSDIHHHKRPFICETCGRCFPRKTKLMEHNRIHTGEKPYICNVCGMAYKANRSLKMHKKSRHGILVPRYEVGISTAQPEKQMLQDKTTAEEERSFENVDATILICNQTSNALGDQLNMQTTSMDTLAAVAELELPQQVSPDKIDHAVMMPVTAETIHCLSPAADLYIQHDQGKHKDAQFNSTEVRHDIPISTTAHSSAYTIPMMSQIPHIYDPSPLSSMSLGVTQPKLNQQISYSQLLPTLVLQPRNQVKDASSADFSAISEQ